MDPSRPESLLRISSPKTAADLQQFVCAANWMRCCIPEFNKVTAVLSEVLEEAYLHAGKRTKRAIAKLSLREHTSWNTAHEKAFQDVKNALYNAATLAHPDPQKLLFIFTDASETHWAGVLTQIPPEDRDLPFDDQRHGALSFLSGSFKGSSSRWSTPEKEAFAFFESISRLDYMILRPEGFHLFKDHKNLIYIFNPVATNPHIAKHVANKIERWAMTMSAFKYTISHITGEIIAGRI